MQHGMVLLGNGLPCVTVTPLDNRGRSARAVPKQEGGG